MGRCLDPALVHRRAGLLALIALVSGWRYRGRPNLLASLSAGALSGFGAGAVQIGAPPLLVFWLGGDNNARTVRANIMVYFILQGVLSMALYFYSGLFNAHDRGVGADDRRALRVRDDGRRLLVSRLERRPLPPHRLCHHRAAGLASLPVFDALR